MFRVLLSLVSAGILFALLVIAIAGSQPRAAKPFVLSTPYPAGPRSPAPVAVAMDAPSTPTPCQQFVAIADAPQTEKYGTGQGIIFGVLIGDRLMLPIWDVPPEKQRQLSRLLDQCLILNRGVTPQIDWSDGIPDPPLAP